MSAGSTLKRSAEGTNGTLLFLFFFLFILFDFPFLYNFKAPFSPVTTLKKTPFISCAHSTM